MKKRKRERGRETDKNHDPGGKVSLLWRIIATYILFTFRAPPNEDGIPGISLMPNIELVMIHKDTTPD